MGVPASITIDFIWKFINPLLGEKIKEAIKRKDSVKIAKAKAFKFYESLGRVKFTSSQFISAFKAYAEVVEKSKPGDAVGEAREQLYFCAENLITAFSKMAEALEDLYPQLEIHQPELYEDISRLKEGKSYSELMGVWLGIDLENACDDAEIGDTQSLKNILAEEEKSYQHLDKCLQDFRKFLSKEILSKIVSRCQ